MAGATFCSVPRDRMVQCILATGFHATQTIMGNEVVVDIHIPECMNVVRIFTSISDRQENVRKAGIDAVRVVVGVYSGFTKRFFPTRQTVTLKRTASANLPDGDRVEAFLKRFSAVLNKSIAVAKEKPSLPCPRCYNPLAWRERRADKKPFLGCFNFPTCKFCMDIPSDY